MVAKNDRGAVRRDGRGGTVVTAGIESDTTGSAGKDREAQQVLARKLNYLIGQITPEEFRRQDANYDRDSALGRELLFLIANNDWARATSEVIDIARSDTVDTTIKIDVELSRIAHEAFRDRTGQLWLPVLVLPPLQSQNLEPDPFATCTVTDPSGTLLATLPNADVRHRVAAALAEIIVNIAIARLPDLGQPGVSASRDQRLLLAAAIYRLLRSESVPREVLTGETVEQQAPGGPAQRIGTARRDLTALLGSYAGLLEPVPAQVGAAGESDGARPGHSPGSDPAASERRVFARVLAGRAIQVLDAFTKSAIVVVAADRARTPTVLTVTVPSRPLREQRPPAPSGRRTPGLFRWLWPSILNRVLPRARLEINLLLPSADADRQVQVNLPDGVSFDPWQKPDRRAELDIRAGAPPPVAQLRYLMEQLTAAPQEWPAELYRALGDLTCAKTVATRETLRDHRVVPNHLREPTDPRPRLPTKEVGDRLDRLGDILSKISAGLLPIPAARERLAQAWERHDDWLKAPMQRRTSTDAVSPDVVVARARMIEDVSQRGAPYQATIGVQVAVTDSEYFSVARFSGSMSILLMSVVLAFFLIGGVFGIASDQVSAEVLAFVLTLFAAVQVGRMERPDRTTLRGLLAQASNLLIGILILPTVVLAVALAFSRGLPWVAGWAVAAITFQLVLQWLLQQRQQLDAGQRDRASKALRTQLRILLCTDPPDYSHAEVLHSTWWRSTTADALLVGRPAHGYVVWQHGATLRSFLLSGRPDHDPASSALAAGSRSERWWRPRRVADQLTPPGDTPQGDPDDPAPARPDPGALGAGDLASDAGHNGANGETPVSLLEQPANVLALQRSGTTEQSVTFAVFRDQPKGDWEAGTEDVRRVYLDASQLAPASDVSGVVGVFLGLPKDRGLLRLADHPVTAVLQAAASDPSRLGVLEIQLPVPAPCAAYAGLQWTRVQVGLRDGDYARLTSFLNDMQALAVRPLVVGVQTVSEGIPRILNPSSPAAANPGPDAEQAETGPARLVLASDLDVVACSGLYRTENAGEPTWRLLAICSDWRSAEEIEILEAVDPGLELAGLTTAVLHGKLVVLLLGHRPGGRGGQDSELLAPAGDDGHGIVYLDEWQSRQQLGEGRQQPLLRVRMRTPDRAGATLEVIESLRETLLEMAPGCLTDADWNVWYTRTVVTAGHAAVIQLTVRLAVDPATTPPGRPIEGWGPEEMSRIERGALARAASKMAASGTGSVADLGLDAPEDTVISVSLITTPDLGGPSVTDPGLSQAATAP